MPELPKVTVLMTLYNKGPFVEEAIRSVLAQTLTDFELLVVDDASTDDGLERVKALGDPRIRILESAENTGRAAAANRGYGAAEGEYIAVLDADDVMLPDRLAKQVAYMDAHPKVGALGTHAQAFGSTDELIAFPVGDRALRAKVLFGSPVLYGSCILRRSMMEEHGIRSPQDWGLPAEDRLFLIELGKYAEYANLSEVLTMYRTGEQNHRHGRDSLGDMRLLVRAVLDRYGIPATDREVALQTMLHKELEGPPPTLREVWQLARWRRKLFTMNRQHQWFPVAEFEQVFDRYWHGLFHAIVQERAAASLLHMLLTKQLHQRFGYWAKATKDRWLG